MTSKIATEIAATVLTTACAAACAAIPAAHVAPSPIKPAELQLEAKWDKVFAQSSKVNHSKITFVNRYGITLAADLYIPKNAQGKLPAIAVSGPFGAVKEQSSGLYAQTLAERGYLTIAFDPSFTGESGGYPRYVASGDINTEDYSAAVDVRIKATVAATMYDMSRVTVNGYFDSLDAEGRYKLRQTLAKERTANYRAGRYNLAGGVPDKLPADAPQFVKDYFNYYKTERGYHKRSLNSNGGWNTTSAISLLNMPLLTYADEIRSAVLIVHGEKAHSRYFGEDAYKKLKGDNKELLIVPGANHTDLYDRMDVIPFDRIYAFYKANLK